MFKLFKGKKEVEQPQQQHEFSYKIFMRDGTIFKCLGVAYSKNSLATHLSDCLESYGNLYFTSEDGGKFILWTNEIKCIKID